MPHTVVESQVVIELVQTLREKVYPHHQQCQTLPQIAPIIYHPVLVYVVNSQDKTEHSVENDGEDGIVDVPGILFLGD